MNGATIKFLEGEVAPGEIRRQEIVIETGYVADAECS